jgi:hypothetical protein
MMDKQGVVHTCVGMGQLGIAKSEKNKKRLCDMGGRT